MKTNNQCLSKLTDLILLLVLSFTGAYAQGINNTDSTSCFQETSPRQRTFKMTTLTFGGNGVNFTRVNDQFSVMTGGRGSATFNNRYTIGGGGWGMTKGVSVKSDVEGTYNFIKMGYGGIDFGYLIPLGKKFNLGAKVLLGGGAVFKETVPESDDKDFGMFPVMEPTVYSQIALGKLFRFEMGASYRFITGTNLSCISAREISGFSCYIGFLIRAAGND